MASSDESTNTERSKAAASARSSLQRRRTLAGDGSCGVGSRLTSVTSFPHSSRNPATSSGGTFTVSASCAALPSSPPSSCSIVANDRLASSRPAFLSSSAISGISCLPNPQTSASAASTQTGDARNASSPMSSIPLPAARRARKFSASARWSAPAAST